MGPQNAVMGNDAYGTELPQTQTPEDAMTDLLNTAKFSKTREFQELKTYLEGRMDFYKTYLPNGTPTIAQTNMFELGQNWVVAAAIIGEFKAVLDVYENAAQQAKDAAPRRK